MKIRLLIIATLFSLFTISQAYSAPGRGLAVGSPAPGLNVEWVKGEFNPGDAEVYVIEFWATGCLPCRKSIPHLTRLQEEFGEDGLKIVGISVDENTDLVNPFVKRQGVKMDYIVGIDNRKRTARSWMDAAGLKGIPAAFIVDREGIIQFIGSPLNELFEEILEKVMSGRYNLKKQQEAASSIKAAKSYRAGNSWAEAAKAYDNAIKIDNIVFAHLYLEQFRMLLLDKNDPTAAYKYITKIMIERGSEDPELLTWIAKDIASNEDIPESNRKMEFALNTAKTALSFARRKTDPKFIATIAFVHFHDGNIDEAIEWQRKAYFSAREKDKASYKNDLDSYQMQKQHVEVAG